MIVHASGNILDANVEAIVNPVNTVGVMGKGLALAFKQRYPENMALYKTACESNQLKVGKMFVTKNNSRGNPKYIVNFPTKQHWKDPSKLEWIESGLCDLHDYIIAKEVQSIAIPALGCGNGGLNWGDVFTRIVHHLHDIDTCTISIYSPY